MNDDNTPSAGKPRALSKEQRELGMGQEITRRDFLNAAALGTGATLLGASAPGLLQAAAQSGSGPGKTPASLAWTGYSGVGDYARSNGNTFEVVNAGHGIRDHLYQERIGSAA